MKDRNAAATSAQNTRRMAGSDSGPVRRTPSIAEAEGMLTAIQRQHECTEACTGTVTLGDGHVVALTCPWQRLDMGKASDRRLVGSVYASEARAALAVAEARA